MPTHPLEAHRRTTTTALGDVSHLDVGDGPVAVLVHGVATNALLWRDLIPLVSDVRRCVAIDLPLHGHTPAAPGQDFTLQGLAAGNLSAESEHARERSRQGPVAAGRGVVAAVHPDRVDDALVPERQGRAEPAVGVGGAPPLRGPGPEQGPGRKRPHLDRDSGDGPDPAAVPRSMSPPARR